MGYPAEPTPTCDTAPPPPASGADVQTDMGVMVSAQDAGLTADANVVNLAALRLLDGSSNGSLDAGVSAKVAGLSLGDGVGEGISLPAVDSGIQLALAADVPELDGSGFGTGPILGVSGLLGGEVACLALPDVPDVDLCSLTQQIGL